MRHGFVAGLAVAGLLALTGCSDDGSSGDGGSAGATRPALTQPETVELLLEEDEFPLEGYTRGEPAEISTDVAVLAASALMDSEQLDPGCREAAELARSVLPPQAGSQVTFTAEGEDGQAHQVTVMVFSTVVEVDYFGAYADQAEACGTVEENDRVLELAPLQTEGVQGYTLGTDLGGLRVDLVLAGRSVGFNHAAVTALDLSEQEAVRVLQAQMDKVTSSG
jgi:hypothetical protein